MLRPAPHVDTLSDTELIRNVLAVYARASAPDLAHGLAWYRDARAECERAGDVRGVALAVACLSPGLRWEDNLGLGAEAYRGACGAGLPGNPEAWGKAARVLAAYRAGASDDAIRATHFRTSPKTWAFYLSILHPDGNTVCVDGHAYNIATIGADESVALPNLKTVPGLASGVTSDPAGLRRTRYERLSAAYVSAARAAGIAPVAIQAVTWARWRQAIRGRGARRRVEFGAA